MTPDTIWCLGMYASASTWLFNVVLEIARTLYPGAAGSSASFVHTLANLEVTRGPARLAIIKSHETEPAAADELGRLGRHHLRLDPRPARCGRIADDLPGSRFRQGAATGRGIGSAMLPVRA